MADLTGTPGDDFLIGTEEDDSILGLGGDDFLNGGGGDDFISGGAGADDLFGVNGDDTLKGGGGADILYGGDGADDLRGGEGDDTLEADISIESEFQQDSLRGGNGADQFNFFVKGPGSTINVPDIILDFEGAGMAGGDTLLFKLPFDESKLLVYRGRADATNEPIAGDGLIDVFFAEVFDNDTAIYADSNDDGSIDFRDLYVLLPDPYTLNRADFGDTEFSLVGDNVDNLLIGNAFGDPIFGLGGDDTLEGRAADDQIEGGDGDDLLSGGSGDDRVAGGRGADTIDGGRDRDFITGDEGGDSVRGGKDDDNVSGGDGDDSVYGDAGDDNVDGDEGNDTSYGGAGDDNLFASDNDDLLYGGADEDVVEGGEGNDTMFGGADDDELIGDEGADVNTGGAGNDEFLLFLGTFAPSSDFGANDTITDFEGAGIAGGDVINLGGARLAFAGEISIVPEAGAELPGAGDGVTQLVYTQSGGDTFLIADDNDDGVLGSGDFFLRVEGIHDFTVNDFDNVDFVTVGTSNDDTIRGTGGGDTIFGVGGDDLLFGRAGDDSLDGGRGSDSVHGGAGFDRLNGGQGKDTLRIVSSDGGVALGDGGSDTLFGSDLGFTLLYGGRGADELRAGAAGASLFGDEGADRLIGGAGNDGMDGGRINSGPLDGEQDLYVFGADSWGDDLLFTFEDGVDLIDLSGSGLTFDDLTIDDSNPPQTIIISSLGTITLGTFFDPPVEITEADFLFG